MAESPDFAVSSTWTGTLEVTQSTAEPTREHAPVARLVTTPVWVLGVVALLNWSLVQVVEFLALPLVRDLRVAIAPLSFVTLIRGGQWQLNTPALVVFVAAVVLAVLAYTPLRLATVVIMPVAGAAALTMAHLLWPVAREASRGVPALVLGVVLAGMQLVGARRLPATKTATVPRPNPFWFLGMIPTVVVPMAIGRTLAHRTPSARVSSLADLDELIHQSDTTQLVLLGACVLIALAAAGRLVPPYAGRSLGKPITILVATVILGFGYLLPRVGM